ncbi:MFS transporter [Conexibacter sp. DBS9H8]|uniref:MFS transporter n=1 Tax=Conexibacter sp. DBS9H8 TaxID=2937801 RepID=UPI00200D2A18|nr:MFS transporter [Conexibacter sp. DBS9H8]
MSPTRRALLALALGGFGIGTGEFVILGLLPNVAAGLHVSIPHAGYLISAYALGVVVGAPLFTPVSVWIPHRRFLILGAVLLAAGNVASALMPSFGALLVVRFLSGLPHGPYFGVASVVAGRMVSEGRRASAMSIVFAGLTVANVIGVPLSTLVGQHFGWRAAFALVATIELIAALAVLLTVPAATGTSDGPPVRLIHELRAFADRRIWLSLAIAIVGGGAMFCTFSYITPMLTHLAGYRPALITPLLVIFGLGMTAGNLVGARLADRALMATVYAALGSEAVIAGLFFFAIHNPVLALGGLFLFPFCALAVLPALQTRIISLAGGAPNVAAASLHAAFNIANAVGAWVGGAVIAAGLGYGAPNLAAAGIALLGLGIAVIAGRHDRPTRTVGGDGEARRPTRGGRDQARPPRQPVRDHH